jgi:hypothetical protein
LPDLPSLAASEEIISLSLIASSTGSTIVTTEGICKKYYSITFGTILLLKSEEYARRTYGVERCPYGTFFAMGTNEIKILNGISLGLSRLKSHPVTSRDLAC